MTDESEELRCCREQLLMARLERERLRKKAREHPSIGILIGLMGVFWSASGLMAMENLARWQAAALERGGGQTWLAIMLLVGLLQVAGAGSRSLRHIGFVLGTVVWASVFGMFLITLTFTPIIASPATLAAFCACAYVDEVYSRIKYSLGEPNVFFAK